MLDTTPERLIDLLQINVGEDGFDNAAGGIVGADVWKDLRTPGVRAAVVGPAWRGCLDRMRELSEVKDFGRLVNQVLLTTMIHIAAAFTDRSPAIGRSLYRHELSWKGSWRELNIRLADQLYRHGLHRSRLGDDDSAVTALRAALQCWTVVESQTHRDKPDQRRQWRGMRGVTRLFLARRAPDALPQLRAAIEDLRIAEDHGDDTPQHYALLGEAYLRLYQASGETACLDHAQESLRAGRRREPTRELATAMADLLRIRGLHALLVGGVRVATVTAPDAPRELDCLLDDIDTIDDPSDDTAPAPAAGAAMAAAESAFVAAAAWYGHALTVPASGRTDPVIIRIRRGQALLRAVHVRRLTERPYLAVLETALEDLRLCHDDDSPICSDYLPWALLEYGKAALREREGLGPGQADMAFAEALRFIRRRTPEAQAMLDRALTGLAESRIHRARAGADHAELLDAVRDAVRRPAATGLAAKPLIYGCRDLLEPALGGAPAEPAVTELATEVVEWLVRHLESADEGAARYAAGHAGSLLMMRQRTLPDEPLTSWPTERLYRLFQLSVAGDPAPPPLLLTKLARAALWHARAVATGAATANDPKEALAGARRADPLFDEAVATFRRVAEIAAPTWETGDGVDPLGLDVIDSDGTAAPVLVVPDEQTLSSMLGDALLRRGTHVGDVADLGEAIACLERSITLGNAGPEVLGLLADAYLRRGRRLRHVPSVRRAFELKEQARSLGGMPARESWSVSASMAHWLWRATGAPEWFAEAARFAGWAAAVAPDWPWPLLQAAELAEATAAVRGRLAEETPVHPATDVRADPQAWRLLRAGETLPLLLAAGDRVAGVGSAAHRVLGGVSKVYTIADPHRLLSSTMILKPFRPPHARPGDAGREKSRTDSFARWLDERSPGSWARAVRTVTVVTDPTDGHEVLLTWRATGRTLFETLDEQVTAGGVDYPAARETVRRCLTLLAHVHAWRGEPDAPDGMENRLTTYLRSMDLRGHDRLARLVCSAVPDGLPLAGKRDAHTENWIVSEHNEIVALDVGDRGFLPVGYEIAQFLEDMPLLPVDEAGFAERDELARHYLRTLASLWPAVADRLPEPGTERWRRAYACFVVPRAVYLLGRYGRTARVRESATNACRVRHSRELLAWAARIVPSLAELAERVEAKVARRLAIS
ncbi:hypothetical protein QLQ12_43970 [Actinoplanes sp. NEAU-A12]|uniref:Aminoglycoside phosphotransferase domain-containing protein n=1 Tax=Actinoplanes sandaracinus TaxID=3045177 RepID=A0ABT6X0T1_9ACTN|nr:hypothetical protein [Actinoplanes sandaracinus]MDI6105562.1 hypothetical protein [Actinoplanes sandaracinus]